MDALQLAQDVVRAYVKEVGPADLVDMLITQGGFTFDPKDGTFAEKGYAVSPFKGREEVFRSGISNEEVAEYVRRNADLLQLNGTFVGGWVDDGAVYLDISVVFTYAGMAVTVARQHEQKAIFDLARGESIDVAGWGDKL